MEDVEVTWEGFRGFKKPTSFVLPKITLFIGRNNVGKTSAYAPLLLLRQTLGATNPDTALLGRGPLIDAGPFSDYVSDHNEEGLVSFTVGLPERPVITIEEENDLEIEMAAMEVEFATADGHTPFVQRHRIIDSDGRSVINRSRDEPGEAFNVVSRLLPSRLRNGRPTRELTGLRNAITHEQPRGFLFDGSGGVFLPRSYRQDKDRWLKIQDWYEASFNVYELHREANLSIRNFLRRIAYIGPLRSLPLRTYRLAAEAPRDVGQIGESAPEVLFHLRDQEAGAVVFEWLQILGYGVPSFKELSEEYFQVLLKGPSGIDTNLADSGVGLSQVLPLLVEGATSGTGSTLIAQQPEIHLNPAQQSIVTDFLISRAEAGVRVVIETHSEHILLRLRRRIAEGALASEDVAVYYLDNVNGETTSRRVQVGDSGEIERNDWPKGFFEDQLADSFALASAQSVKAQSK